MATAASLQPTGRLKARKAKWGYIFLLPWIAIFLVFYAYPLIYGITVSFTDRNLGGGHFIGIQNYVDIFDHYAFWRSVRANLCYAAITIPLQVILPLLVANVLRPHSNRVNNCVKLLIYLPGVICTVAQVIIWKFIFAPNSGMIAQFLIQHGIRGFAVFEQASTAIPIVSLLIIFTNMGQTTVIYTAAIGAIPETYYEAAELDGASRFQQFLNITVPMLFPTIVYVLITSTIGSLQIFVIPQLLTAGGPNYTTSTLMMLIYDSAFNNHKFGYASALGVILFVITGIVAFIQFKATNREAVEY